MSRWEAYNRDTSNPGVFPQCLVISCARTPDGRYLAAVQVVDVQTELSIELGGSLERLKLTAHRVAWCVCEGLENTVHATSCFCLTRDTISIDDASENTPSKTSCVSDERPFVVKFIMAARLTSRGY